MKHFLLIFTFLALSTPFTAEGMQQDTRLRKTGKGDSNPEEKSRTVTINSPTNNSTTIFNPINNVVVTTNQDQKALAEQETTATNTTVNEDNGTGMLAALGCGAVGMAGIAGVVYGFLSFFQQKK